MLHIYKGQDNNLIFTALELCTLTNPKYLFVFTSANEKIVKFVGVNISTDNRYQKVLVATSIFKNQEPGTWRYQIREQESETNTNIALSGNVVEEGFMYLHEEQGCESSEYTDQCNEFKTYNG